jgi:invasion protein IalB
MSDLIRSLTLTLALSAALSAPALAQETTTEQAPAAEAPAEPVPGTELSLGQEAPAPEPYVKATHGDWQLRCLRTEDGSDPCEIYQLLKDDKGNSVAEITMVALPDGEKALAGATVVVPLETLLPPQLKLVIDGGKEKFYPYSFCAPVGCFSRIGFTAEEVEQLKKGAKATVSVVPYVAPDQVVSVDISLKGFTDAFEAVKAERPAPKQ